MWRSELLAFAVVVPGLMGLAALLYVLRRRRAAAVLGDRTLFGRISGHDLHAVPWRRIAPLLIASAALGLALSGPARGAAGAAPGARNVVLVLDASNSMLVEDVEPNRLELQRRLARRLLRELSEDRVGVVAFAGQASVLAPPTRDHAAVAMFIDAVRPEIAVQTGSALAAGIRQASSLLAAGPPQPGARLVVLVSDGEAQDAGSEIAAAAEAASRAARLGIVVHTVGVGTPSGGPVPDVDAASGLRRGFKTDPATGNVATSALDETLLRDLARSTRGSFHHLSDAPALDALIAELRGAGTPATQPPGSDPVTRSLWLAALALVLVAGDAVAAHRRERRLL